LRKKALVAAVCLAAIAASLSMLLRPARRTSAADLAEYRSAWVCEACGETFRALPGQGKRACPACGKPEGVQSVLFVCGPCGREFEGYRRVDYYDAEARPGEGGKVTLPLPHFKRAGGEWTTDRSQLGRLRCPACGNEDAARLQEKTFGPPKR
jgi:hypothetical protein